jgi:hypothetical protein
MSQRYRPPRPVTGCSFALFYFTDVNKRRGDAKDLGARNKLSTTNVECNDFQVAFFANFPPDDKIREVTTWFEMSNLKITMED